MVQDGGKEEEKLEFTAEGEAIGYISLDQARVLALRHARDNTDFYGRRYGNQDLAWDVLDEQEREDYYYIRLSYRPVRGFRGQPGVELFTIDKMGPIELRQILVEPQPEFRLRLALSAVGLLAAVGGIVGGLAASGVFSTSPASPDQLLVTEAPAAVSVSVVPDAPAQLLSPGGDVTVDLPLGSVEKGAELRYQPLSSDQIPPLTSGFLLSGRPFDLSVTTVKQQASGTISLARPITITVRLSDRDIALAGGVESNLILQHYKDDVGWTSLSTLVDFTSSTARAQVDSLSLFALTIRERATAQVPGLAATATPSTDNTPTPSSAPLAAATPTTGPIPTVPSTPTPATAPVATPTPLAIATPIPVPVPTPTPLPQYLLETAISPEDQGSVETLPESDDGNYPIGTVVAVTAQCNLGFLLWAGDIPSGESRFSDTISVPMDRERVLVALCARPTPTPTPAPTATPSPRYKLSINSFEIGPGQGTLSVGNGTIVLSQAPDDEGTYVFGAELTLTADTGGIGAQVF